MDISPVVDFAWQIATREAAGAKHQYIEIEHIFIGLCKVLDALKKEEFRQIEKLRAELEPLENIFNELSIDRKRLYRRLRAVVGQGDYEYTDKVIHRSEECKELFAKAEEIAISYSASKFCSLHLLLAILEEPGDLILEAISEYDVEIDKIKEKVSKIVKEEIPLTKSGIKKILTLTITELETQMKAQGIDIKVKNEVIEFLCNKSYFGKRTESEIKVLLKSELKDRLEEMILKKEIEKGEGVVVNIKIAITNVTRVRTEDL